MRRSFTASASASPSPSDGERTTGAGEPGGDERALVPFEAPSTDPFRGWSPPGRNTCCRPRPGRHRFLDSPRTPFEPSDPVVCLPLGGARGTSSQGDRTEDGPRHVAQQKWADRSTKRQPEPTARANLGERLAPTSAARTREHSASVEERRMGEHDTRASMITNELSLSAPNLELLYPRTSTSFRVRQYMVAIALIGRSLAQENDALEGV